MSGSIRLSNDTGYAYARFVCGAVFCSSWNACAALIHFNIREVLLSALLRFCYLSEGAHARGGNGVSVFLFSRFVDALLCIANQCVLLLLCICCLSYV